MELCRLASGRLSSYEKVVEVGAEVTGGGAWRSLMF